MLHYIGSCVLKIVKMKVVGEKEGRRKGREGGGEDAEDSFIKLDQKGEEEKASLTLMTTGTYLAYLAILNSLFDCIRLLLLCFHKSLKDPSCFSHRLKCELPHYQGHVLVTCRSEWPCEDCDKRGLAQRKLEQTCQ